MIPIILFSSGLYFYKVGLIFLFFYTTIIIFLIFIKKIKGNYDSFKSVFFNFYKNSSKTDMILIVAFIVCTFIFKTFF